MFVYFLSFNYAGLATLERLFVVRCEVFFFFLQVVWQIFSAKTPQFFILEYFKALKKVGQ